MLLSSTLAMMIPLAFLYIVWNLEVFELSRRQWLVAGLVWGVVAFALAALVQNFLLRGFITYAPLALVIAPILEELLKGTFIIGLAWRNQMRVELDGVIYGFAVGTGFSIVENLYYLQQDPNAPLETILIRVISSSLMHAVTTALLGMAVGLVNNEQMVRRVRYNGAGLILAILIHAVFNAVVLLESGFALTVAAAAIGLGGLYGIMTIMQLGLKRQRVAIEQQLQGMISTGEMVAIRQPEQLVELLRANRQNLGNERVKVIQDYVVLQAKRAILSQTLSTARRPDFMPTLRKQVTAIENEIMQLQQNMGVYTSTWLRSVLPSKESDIWRHLQVETAQESPLLTLIQELNTRHATLTKSDILKRKAVLSAVNLFNSLSGDELTDIAVMLEQRTCQIGEAIIKQNEINDSLYFVAQGRLLANALGKSNASTIITSYKVGDSFGEVGIFDSPDEQVASQVSVIATEPVVLYSLQRRDFLTLIYAKPNIAMEVMRQLSRNVRRHTDIITNIRDNQPELIKTFVQPEEREPVILVVDDEPTSRDVLAMILRKENYQLMTAEDVAEARDHLKYTLPDLILLDIMLPKVNGFDWALELKNYDATRDIPIIFISALSDIKHVIKGFDIGAVDYIAKPFHAAEVLVRVRNHLEIVKLRQRSANQAEQIKVLLRNSQIETQELRALVNRA